MVVYTIQEFKFKVKIFYLEQRCNGEPSSSCSIGSTSSSEEVQPLDLLDGFLLEEAMISNAVLNSSARIVSSSTSLKLLPLLGERESMIRKKKAANIQLDTVWEHGANCVPKKFKKNFN
jgi:hypothetical protein